MRTFKMRNIVLSLLVILLVAFTACKEKVDDAGAVGVNTGNPVGDDPVDETNASMDDAGSDEPVDVMVGDEDADSADPDDMDEPIDTRLITAYKKMTLEETNDYLGAFVNRKTAIAYDQERGKGPLVAGAIELLNYYGYNEMYENRPLNTKGKHITAQLDKNLILLGNGCNNDLIRDVLDNEDCRAGLKEGQALIRYGKVDDKRVLLIIGYDDVGVYETIKKMVAGKVPFSGPEKLVLV